MSDPRPTRTQSDLAEVLELVLDKGIVLNADIAVTVGDTELLGIELRAAIASFETAAEYGLAFPSGTDMRRVEQASGREPLETQSDEVAVENDDGVDLGIEASEGGSQAPPRERPNPEVPTAESEGDDEAEDATPEEGADTDGDDTDDEGNDESERQGEGEDT